MGILTWSGSTDLLHALLDKVEQLFDSNIKLRIYIDIKVNFLQLFTENQRDSLYTRCSRDRRQSQRFLLPYTRGHPRIFHRQWFRFALIRAGLYCSSFEDFENERIYLEATLLANGYTLDFVEYHLRQFYPIQQQQLILNSLTYNTIHRELFRFIEQEKNQIQYELQLNKNHQLIQLYYFSDWRSQCQFNIKFYELWSSIIEQDPKFKKYVVTIGLQTKHCYSSNTLS